MPKTEVKSVILALRAKLSDAWGKTLSTAKAGINGVGDTAKGAASKLTMGMAGLIAGAAAAAGGMAAYVVHTSKAMAETGRLSDRLGVSTEGLIGLRAAFGKAGISADEADGNLSRFVARLGGATDETGGVADVLHKLGLEGRTLAALPLDKQMEAVADAMKGLHNPSERAAVAVQMFGKSGAAMAEAMKDGGAGLRKAAGDADAMGLTYSRQSAAMAEQLTRSLGTMKKLYTGIGLQLVSAVLPWVTKVSELFVGWVKSSLPYVQAGFSVAFQVIGNVLSSAWTVIETVVSAIGNVWESLGGKVSGQSAIWKTILDGLKAAWDWLAEGAIRAITLLEAAVVNWRDTLTILIDGAILGVVKFADNVRYFFCEVAPAYLQWFGGHWRDVFTTMWNFVKTFATNVGANLAELFRAIKDLATGKGWNFKWTGLLDGFESTIKELPKIAERNKTGLEKELEASIGQASGNIADYYESKITERLDKLKARRDEASKIADKLNQRKSDSVGGPLGNAGMMGGKAQDFGVLSRAVSLAGLSLQTTQQDKMVKNTADTAAALSRIEGKIATGAAVFVA